MSKAILSQNYYDLLEVPLDAGSDQIQRAYLQAKETFSCDNPALFSVFTKKEAQELMTLIDDAFQVLSNAESKRKYDHKITEVSFSENVPAPPPENADKPGRQKTLPDGHARTKISSYKVNHEYEEELLSIDLFDGIQLRRLRESRNIDIPSLSQLTRVSKSYLEALEDNSFKDLPAPVFVRGFLKQLLSTYEINDERLIKSYMMNLKTSLEAK